MVDYVGYQVLRQTTDSGNVPNVQPMYNDLIQFHLFQPIFTGREIVEYVNIRAAFRDKLAHEFPTDVTDPASYQNPLHADILRLPC